MKDKSVKPKEAKGSAIAKTWEIDYHHIALRRKMLKIQKDLLKP